MHNAPIFILIDFHCQTTLQPLKTFFMPQNENLAAASKNDAFFRKSNINKYLSFYTRNEPQCLFGMVQIFGDWVTPPCLPTMGNVTGMFPLLNHASIDRQFTLIYATPILKPGNALLLPGVNLCPWHHTRPDPLFFFVSSRLRMRSIRVKISTETHYVVSRETARRETSTMARSLPI